MVGGHHTAQHLDLAMTTHPATRSLHRILVIDDEELVIRALARILLRRFDVTVAHSPRAAFARITAGDQYDLILCDMHMPEMAGGEFLQALRAANCAMSARVVLMSGDALGDAGGLFLDKPFSPAAVYALVEEALALPSEARA